MSEKNDANKLRKANSWAQLAARKAKSSGAGVKFTRVLGGGAYGNVFQAEMTAPTPVMSSGCSRGGVSLESLDREPVVKVAQEKRDTATVQKKREYDLARWAFKYGFGPAVHCQATWDLGTEGVFHLIFMEKMYSSLLHLALDTEASMETKKLAWAFAFQQLARVSKAKPPSIGLDLKPENILVSADSRGNLDGVFISDWDPQFWKSVPKSDEALLFNYVALVSSVIFPAGAIPQLCEQLPSAARKFARRLVNDWSKSSEFRKYLIRWDAQFIRGLYHYGLTQKELKKLMEKKPEVRADAYLKALQSVAAHYGTFACDGEGLPVPGGSGDRVLKLAKARFG